MTLILASFYATEKQDLELAIRILTKHLDTKASFQQFDRDFADALYNRACYYARLANTATEEKAATYRNLALQDLERCISIRPEHILDASNDADLESLRTDPRFLELLSREGTAQNASM